MKTSPPPCTHSVGWTSRVSTCLTLLICLLLASHARAQTATITVNRSIPLLTSSYWPSMSQIDNSLDYPYGSNNGAAVTNARTLISNGITWMNNHIMAWGVSDPWPDPAVTNPTVWSGLDKHMSNIINMGCTPMITLCEAPWWMKGSYQADGTTKLIPDVKGEWDNYTYTNGITDFRGIHFTNGYVSPDPYGCRILDSQMNKWLLLVQRVAERYMVPPYNVTHFQVWNEMKGYYNPALNRWQYENTAGNTNGYNAQHGYTYMYNQAYARLRSTADNLGIGASNIWVGGPYIVMSSGSSSNVMSNPSGVKGPWGIFDKRELDVISYWLTNKTGAQFICMDGSNGNQFGTNPGTAFMRCQKFAAANNWVRTQNGGASLPIVWSEWYTQADVTGDNHIDNALGACSALQQILSSAAITLLWGGEASAAAKPALFTSTDQVGGGQALPWYDTYKTIGEKFGDGMVLYQTTNSSTNVSVIASASWTMLVNQTSSSINVTLDGNALTLTNYEVRLVAVPPAAPSALGATTISSSQINLSWTDNANNESGFAVERKTGSGGTYAQIGTTAANGTTFSSTGLSPNTTYYYRVRATNDAGNSAYCTETSATTLPLPPAAPSGLVLTVVATNQINLSWTDNATNETGFKIERKTGSGGTYSQIGTTGANVTTFASTNLNANTTYYFRVRATNTGGDSGYCPEQNATTFPFPPAAPSGLGLTVVSASQIDLAWTDNATNETGFKVERKTGSGGTYSQIGTTGANTTTFSSTNLSPNTTYYFRVRATNAGGDSGYCTEMSATTLPLPPADPSGLVVTAISTKELDLVWVDNSTNETGFKIERKTGAGGTYSQIATVGANATSFANTNLSPDTIYYYRVRANNAGGDSGYCPEAGGRTFAVAPNVTGAPTIDGSIDNVWASSPASAINNVILGTVSSDSDLSGTVQMLWDTSYLYLLVDVTDDAKVNDSGTQTYNDDGLEIYIDADNSKPATYGANQYQYSVRWNDTVLKESKHNATNGVVFAKADTAAGYRIEIKFPWTTWGITPAAANRVGLEVQVNDDDDGGVRDGKKSWWGTADTAYLDPSTFGTIELGAVNVAPTVTLTAPANNAVLNAGNITLTATASDTDGTISTVDFYQGSTLIGSDSTSPYSFTWNASPGFYAVTAKATDSSGAVTTSSAANIEVTTDALVASTASAPTIDGNIDAAWANAVSYSISNVILGTVSSTNDLSGTFRTMWDSSNLYLLIDVTDDAKVNDSGTQAYNDDSIEIYIDADNSKSTTFGANDYQYTIRWNDTVLKESKHNATNGVVFAKVDTATGYRIEIAYPWTTLGTTPAAGALVGLEVQINDDDDGGTRDGKKSWWGASDTAYQDPSTWGTARLR